MRAQELLRRAERLVGEVTIRPVGAEVEVLWLRQYRPHISSLMSVTGRSLLEALELLLDEEESIALRLHHGEACPCEDCCCDRVDRERRARRKP